MSLPRHTDLLLAFRTIPEIDTSDFLLVFDTRTTRGTRISQRVARRDTKPWLTEAETLITPKCIPDFDFRRTTGFTSHASQMTRREKHLPVEDRENSLCYRRNMVTPAHRAAFFLHFESSAARIDDSVMQSSCSHLHRLVIIALIMLAACRLMVTVLSLHVVFRRKWGSHFAPSFPPFISAVPGGCCRSLKMTPISTILVRPRVHARDWRGWQDGAAVNWTEDVRKTRTATQRSLSWKEVDGKRKRPLERRQSSLWGNVKKSHIPSANENPLSSPRLL